MKILDKRPSDDQLASGEVISIESLSENMETSNTGYDDATRREMERLYDLLCTSQLNVRYYGCRIGAIGKRHLGLQVVPALASVSALAGLLTNAWDWGKGLWSLIVVLSAVVTAISPLLGLGQKLQRIETLHFFYLHIYHLCECLMLDIERTGRLDAEHVGRSKMLRDWYSRVGPMDETSVNQELCSNFGKEVKRALPPEQFGLTNPSSAVVGPSTVPPRSV